MSAADSLAVLWQERFLDAALDPARWMAVLQELADATGSARAELVGFGPELTSFNWVTSSDDRMLADYQRAGGGSPEFNYRILADAGSQLLEIVHENAYDQARKKVSGDAYLDFCEEYDMPFGCQTCLVRTEGALVGLSILRTRSEGRTTPAQRRIFAEAAGAASNAVRMQRAMEEQAFHLLGDSFEAMSVPCLLLDRFALARRITAAAERLLSENPLLELRGGRLSSGNGDTRRRLEIAFHKSLGPERSPHQRVLMGGGGPIPHLVLDLFRLPARQWALPFAPVAIAVLQDRRAAASANSDRLSQLFSLTPAEAQVALALASGQSREAIAAARSVSLETVRAQVKSLYQKTGCVRETELALLVNATLR